MLSKRLGQSTTEYALMLALVAMIVAGAIAILGARTSGTITDAGNALASLGTDEDEDEDLEVHVGGIDLEVHLHHDHVRGHVTVFDQDGVAVEHATVNASWFVNGVFAETESGGTNTAGRASFAYGIEELSDGDVVRLAVTSVSASGYAYDSGSNVETQDEVVFP